MRSSKFCAASAALSLCVACGGNALAPARSADASASIRAAEAAGARNEPRAALHLKLAKEQAARAEASLRKGQDDEARLLLEQASADAELALVLTRTASVRAEVEQSHEKVRELEQNN